MTDKITYEVVEIEDRKMTQLLAKGPMYPNGLLVAFWCWGLVGRYSAYQQALALQKSRQRMADAGKPLKIDHEFLSGPRGTQYPKQGESREIGEQYVMPLKGGK